MVLPVVCSIMEAELIPCRSRGDCMKPYLRAARGLDGLNMRPPVDHHVFASAAIRRTDWHFVTNTQSPLLASSLSAIHQGTL